MTKKQKLDHVLRHGPLPGDTLFLPILMHFAARHGGVSYAEFCADHHARVAANLACLERFDLDCVTLMSDPYAETSAFGARIEYLPEAVPRCRDVLVRDASDIDALPMPDVFRSERCLDRLRGAERFQRELRGTVPVIGWVEGPLAEACDLADMTGMFTLLMMDPDASHRLLDHVLEFGKAFAAAQIEAGCDIIGIGDAACSQVDEETYRTFVRDRHVELIEHIHARGGIVKFHVCGNTTHLLPSFAGLGFDLIDLDWPVGIEDARAALGPDVLVTGNIDPVEVLERPADGVYDACRALVDGHRAERYALAGGCEIGVNTPPDNLLAMLRAARSHAA